MPEENPTASDLRPEPALEAIEGILAGKKPPQPEAAAPEREGRESAPEGEPETAETLTPDEATPETAPDLAALAEKLAMSPKELYKVLVPLGKGENPVTLGELKDAWQDAGKRQAEAAGLKEQRQKFELEAMSQRREIETLLAALPAEAITPELAHKARAEADRYMKRERELMLKAIPEWSDSSQLQADREQILAFIEPYGFSESDLSFVTDHRLVRMLRDMARRENERATVKDRKVTPAPARTDRPTKAQRDSGAERLAKIKRERAAGRLTDLNAVAALLESGADRGNSKL